MKKNIIGLTLEELKNEFSPDYRAKQIFSGIHKHLKEDFFQINSIPYELKSKLTERFTIDKPEIVEVSISPSDKTEKFLFLSSNNITFEAVLIKENARRTVCVSTQAGCNVGCPFCATGQIGLKKNLSPAEIVSQVYQIISYHNLLPTNIVYMGMGEPFLNYENVLKSLLILTHPLGLGISSRRITVSTVGFVNKIKKFADDITSSQNPYLQHIKLALSLHSTDKGIREKLIPTAAFNPLNKIYDELIYFYRTTGTKITYEYIYFEGINDNPEDINRLEKLSRMVPSNINVIPFHPVKHQLEGILKVYNWSESGMKFSLLSKKINSFIAELRNRKVVVHLRSSSGQDINAACGQLSANHSGYSKV
ncbi:MAG: 23S rRNA (adenine(2503)-C(2))-methyltransferase RlmN [Ignavibacteria bacterium]